MSDDTPASRIPRPIPGWSPSTPSVTGETFDELVRTHPAVAIHFWAPWNGHDPKMDRSICGVSSTLAGRVYFASCNVDLEENRELCKRCGVLNVPYLAVFVRGKERRPVLGYRPAAALQEELMARIEEKPSRKKWWQFWRRAVI